MEATTELEERRFESQHSIQLAFWMQGDFLVMIVFHKKYNKYYVELYQYDQKKMHDSYELFESKDTVIIKDAHSKCRSTSAVYIEEQDNITKRITSRRLIVLKSTLFKNEE